MMNQIKSCSLPMFKPDQQIHNEFPLTTSLKRSAFKYCKRNADTALEPQNMHFEKLDGYWSEFLQAQQNSSVNYNYRIQNFTCAQDPNLVKRKGVPKHQITQLVLDMSYTAGLLREELFYLLSVLLNLMQLPKQMQQQYMDHMLARQLLDVEIVNYLEIIAHHPKAGITDDQQKEFLDIVCQLKHKDAMLEKISFYNAEHIFIKPSNCINPYELEYLRNVLQSNKMLTAEQTLYLAKFVCILQQLPCCDSQNYLKFLRENNIMPFETFECLIVFLVTRAKRPDRNKLRHLLSELSLLVDILSYEYEIETFLVERKQPAAVRCIEIDYSRIRKALKKLMNSVVPNIIHVTDLKNFLKCMIMLDRQQVVNIFNELKMAKIMTPERFKYLENFINQGKLGKIDKIKKTEFIQLLRTMATQPINEDVILKLDIPSGKGPRREKNAASVSQDHQIGT